MLWVGKVIERVMWKGWKGCICKKDERLEGVDKNDNCDREKGLILGLFRELKELRWMIK